jgi:hypothetical protein
VDVERVVRFNFPDCNERMIKTIATRIVSTPGFLNTIPALSNLADFIAEERGEGTRRTHADILRALEELAPSLLVAAPPPAQCEASDDPEPAGADRPRGRNAARPAKRSADAIPANSDCRPGAVAVQSDRSRPEISLSDTRPRGATVSGRHSEPVALVEV